MIIAHSHLAKMCIYRHFYLHMPYNVKHGYKHPQNMLYFLPVHRLTLQKFIWVCKYGISVCKYQRNSCGAVIKYLAALR